MQLLTYSPAVCLSADFNVSHVVILVASVTETFTTGVYTGESFATLLLRM